MVKSTIQCGVEVAARVCVARSAQCVSDAELVFVLATGAEMDPYYMPRLHEFVANVTRSLPVDSGQVRVGVITYGATPLIDIALGHYTTADELIAALANLTYHGTRYLPSPLHTCPLHCLSLADDFHCTCSVL